VPFLFSLVRVTSAGSGGMASDRKERWTRWDGFLIAVVTLYPLFVYHRVWLGAGTDAAHFWGDATGSYWPDLAFFARALREADLPLWNPNDRGGFAFGFDPQPGVLYPLNWLLAGGAAIGGGTPYWLMQLKLLVHPMIAASGWFLFLRCGRHASPAGSAVGALAGSLGLFSLQQVHFSLAWPIAYVPFALLWIDALLERPSTRTGLLLGAALGGLLVAGSPPAAFYGALVIASYAVIRTGTCWRWVREHWRSLGAAAGAALGVAMVVSLPVLWGGAMLTAESVLSERNYAYVSSGALTTQALPHFVLPAGWAGLPLYAGVSVVVLAAAALVARAPNVLAIWAAGVAVVGLLLALGDTTPVLRWANALFPPVRLFRGAARYVYLVQVGLAVLAALGADALIGRARASRWLRNALIGAVALVLVASVAQTAARQVFWRAGADHVLLWLGLLAASVAVARTRRGVPFAIGGILLTVGLDLGAAAQRAGALRGGKLELAPKIDRARMASLLAESPNKRVWDEFALGFRAGSRLGVRDLRGYMDPLRSRRYTALVDALRVTPDLLGRYNVHYVLPAPHPYHGTGHNHVAPARLSNARALEPHAIELPDAAPVAFWTNRASLVDTDEQAWSALKAKPRQLETVAVGRDVPGNVREEIDAVARSGAVPERRPARLVEREANRLLLELEAPSAGIVVVNEAWFPDWRATVDGQPVELWPTDGWVRALWVEAGQHRVELVFRPTAWLVSAACAVIAWLLLAAAGIAWILRRARASRQRG
jgi:hypothetical protein